MNQCVAAVAISGSRKSERKVARTVHLVSRIYKCQRVTRSPHFAFLCTHQLYFDSRHTSSISKMPPFNDFAGYSRFVGDESHLDSDAPIADPSRPQD